MNTKIANVKDTITWKIEMATENLKNELERLRNEANTENLASLNAYGIAHSALRIQEYQEELRLLYEQLKMIEYIEKED